MWKLQSFSITLILREINFWDCRSAKSDILTHIEALNFDSYAILHVWKARIDPINRIQIYKNGSFSTSGFSKINFHKF